jgi:hypothetical protein
MSYPVTYYCPHCEALVELEREGYLADKAVTPFPFEGWRYVAPDESFEDREDVDGVAFTCGEDGTLREGERGCGESFYLSFVRFEHGEEVDPRKPSERVEIGGESVAGPSGPTGPSGPGSGGFW